MAGLIWINEKEDERRYLGEERDLAYCSTGSTKEPVTQSNTTALELAAYCDDEAENANYHHLAGAHEKLAKMIIEKATPEAAWAVLFEIALKGGLQYFNE